MQDNTHAFIVRVWHEPEDQDSLSGAWRGSIIHVGSECRQHFQNLDGIVRFIEQQLGVPNRRRRLSMRSLLGRFGND